MVSPSTSQAGETYVADGRWVERDREVCVPARHFARYGWLNPILGVLLLLVGLPCIAVLVVVTKLTSRGAGIYRQSRVGLGGKTFVLYKIRTMSHDAEAATGPVWTAGAGDPRVTALGRFLRASHLDELPQLFNVVKGEMALIGPRPERPEFTQFLAQEIPGYTNRLAVKPGITGLAQINLPPDTDLKSVGKKLELDLEYITRSTLALDLKILLCTALKMVGLRGYEVAKWLGLVSWPKGLRNAHSSLSRRYGLRGRKATDAPAPGDNDEDTTDELRSVSPNCLQKAAESRRPVELANAACSTVYPESGVEKDA